MVQMLSLIELHVNVGDMAIEMPVGFSRNEFLKKELERAVVARGATYGDVHAVITFFEDDDSAANLDANSLKYCLEDVFNITATVVQLRKDDCVPAFTLRTAIFKVLEGSFGKSQLPTLLIIAYIGHAAIDHGTTFLKFTSASGKQNIQWKFIDAAFFSDDDAMDNIETLGILDCCFASATRVKHNRTSQVLAACERNEVVRSRSAGYISFTQRLTKATRGLYQSGAPLVTVDMLLQKLQDEKPPGAPNATIRHVGGTGRPISLPFKRISSGLPPLQRLQIGSPNEVQEVLVKLSVAGPTKEAFDKFKDTLASLPSEFKVEIVDAFQSRSVAFLLRMTWLTYSRLSSVVDFKFVDAIVGPSLVHNCKYILPTYVG